MKRTAFALGAIIGLLCIGLVFFAGKKQTPSVSRQSSKSTSQSRVGQQRPTLYEQHSAPPVSLSSSPVSALPEKPSRFGGEYTRAGSAIARMLASCKEICGPDAACNPSIDMKTIDCFKSNCNNMTDKSCGADQTCERVQSDPEVHRCAPAGEAKLGATCFETRPAPRDHTCASGLTCIAGQCRESCSLNSCSKGQRCIAINEHDRVCIADICKTDSDCGSDKACVPSDQVLKTSINTCLKIGKFDDGTVSCTPTSCNADQRCDMVRQGDTLMATCRTPCLEIATAACRPGYACGRGGESPDTPFCYRVCAEDHPGMCGKKESCTVSDYGRWFCIPTPPMDTTALMSPDITYTNPFKSVPVQ